MNSNKVTFAAIAAIGVALSLAVVPAFINQVSAFPGENGKGHTTTTVETCENPGGHVKEGDCPGQSEEATPIEETTTTTTFAGKSSHVKDTSSTTE
jgi:hypothetical protein